MDTSITTAIEKKFVETLALLVKEGFNSKEQYKMGWIDGYGAAYYHMTGKTVFQLIDAVNDMLKGSGKVLTIR